MLSYIWGINKLVKHQQQQEPAAKETIWLDLDFACHQEMFIDCRVNQ